MPYLNAEKVKEMRNAIKAAYPKAKFSVTKNCSSSGVRIVVRSSHIDFSDITSNRGYASINPFHFKTQLNEEQSEFISNIIDTMNSVENRCILYTDGDYGNIPNYYYDVQIGSWDQDYVQK